MVLNDTRKDVILEAGGLSRNLLALYPDINIDKLAGITNAIWADNSDTLYSPDVYYVGTIIQVDESKLVFNSPAPLADSTTPTEPQG